jgi:hypothetical protein
VAEFNQALAYFARPDREELLRALFERCFAAPDPVENEPKPNPQPPFEPPSARDPGLPRWVAAALIVFVAGGILLTWSLMRAGGSGPSVAAAVAQTQDAIKALTTGFGGNSAGPPARPAAAKQAAEKPAPARSRSAAATTAARGRARVPASIVQTVPQLHIAAPWSAAALPSAPPAAASSDSAGPPVVAPTETIVVVIEKAIYSSDDADVRPPVMTYPQLPQSALPEIPRPIVNTLELLVGEDGSVERVQMLSRPRRMSDMMILSGIKMWRFRPASKGGRPVRYRTVMNWTVTP